MAKAEVVVISVRDGCQVVSHLGTDFFSWGQRKDFKVSFRDYEHIGIYLSQGILKKCCLGVEHVFLSLLERDDLRVFEVYVGGTRHSDFSLQGFQTFFALAELIHNVLFLFWAQTGFEKLGIQAGYLVHQFFFLIEKLPIHTAGDVHLRHF